MDFTDVIKFFNGKPSTPSFFSLTPLLPEMAEKHDAKALVELARNLVLRLQKAVEK